MYDAQLFRLNIKGIRFDTEKNIDKIKLIIVPFVEFSQDRNGQDKAKKLEQTAEVEMTLDFTDSFNSDTHKDLQDLSLSLLKLKWFKTKNVIIEHAWDEEEGYETISILSNSPNSLELKDKLYCGYETNKNGEKKYFCSLDTQYFLSQQDCPFVRDSLIKLNEKNCTVIRKDKSNKQKCDNKTCLKETAKEIPCFSSKKDALSSIPKKDRKEGMKVVVKLSKSKPKEYTWVGGIEDKDLVLL